MTDIVLLPITNSANVSVVNDNNAKIQQSINEDILHLVGGNNTMLQQLDMNSNKIINIQTDPNDPDSMVTVGAGDSRWYNVAGDTLTGTMNAGGQRIINLPVPVGATEPVRKGEYDSQAADLVQAITTNKLQSVRGQDGEQLTPLPPAGIRANKVMGFDSLGNPISTLPLSGSGTELALDLANSVDPFKGSALVDHREGTVRSALDSITSGLGDLHPDGLLQIYVGDSTTEQAGGSGFMFDYITTYWRGTGMPASGMLGTVNFGGSGYTLKGFVEDPLNPLFVGPTGPLPGVSAGVGVYDYWGHKPVGAVSLATALAWRANVPSYVKHVNWPICYSINDLILSNTVGTLGSEAIADYIADYLLKAGRRIQAAFPKDSILLRMPNPMTARPFNASFPSSTAYPNFDTDEPYAVALVEEWNRGMRLGYQKASNMLPRCALFDSWALVFGASTPSIPAGTGAGSNAALGDRVHPSQLTYRYSGHEQFNMLFGHLVTKQVYSGRRALVDQQIVNGTAGPGYSLYGQYMKNNPEFKELGSWNLVGAGSSFMDVSVNPVVLKKVLAGFGSGRIYCVVGTEEFGSTSFLLGNYTSLTIGASGANSRITGVTPPAAIYTSRATVTFYTDNYLNPPKISFAGALVQGTSVYQAIMDVVPGGISSITLTTTMAVPTNTTVQLYRHISNVRTLIATGIIIGNSFNLTLTSGTDFTPIPAIGLKQEVWEVLPTVATSVPVGCAIKVTLNPS